MEYGSINPRTQYCQTYLKYESYYKSHLLYQIKNKPQFSKRLQNMKNRYHNTKSMVINKSKEKISQLRRNRRAEIAKYCVYYTQLHKKFSVPAEKIAAKSKTRDYFDKLQRKFKINRQKYINPDFDQIYSQLKAKYKMRVEKFNQNIENIKARIYNMKRHKLLAKYSTVGLYLSTLGILIYNKKLGLRHFFLATGGFLGIHMFTQYMITKYYVLSLKNLVV